MKVFYLSSHGFGHIIRSIPFIMDLLQKSDESIYIATDRKQVKFLESYFEVYKDRFIFSECVTDIGFINVSQSIEVDPKPTVLALEAFIKSADDVSDKEFLKLRDYDIKEIFVDISTIGIKVSKLLGVKCIMMTNFTWTEQYQSLQFPQSIVTYFRETESLVDELWLYPLAFPMNYITCKRKLLTFQCRPFNQEKIRELKKLNPRIVTIFTGMSASSKVYVTHFDGLIIHSEHIEVLYDGPKLCLHNTILDSQNYIAASDLVITKAGWTTVSECIVSQTKMVLLERPSAYEDMYIIDQIKKLGYGTSISEAELQSLNIEALLIRRI